MSYLDRVRTILTDLEARSLRRELRRSRPAGTLDFASNDYLGIARDARVVAALGAADGVGSGGSRLLSGAHEEHALLEDALAAWTGRERALLFSSGYLAAIGAIVTLAPVARHAYADAQNHACTIDALRLTKLARTIYPHDAPPPAAARSTPAMLVTESLFGMSGTRVDVAARLAALGPEDILIVDEAHALGVTGPRGAGLCAPFPDPRLVVIGTLSKALGGAGGFVAGPATLVEFLATAARTFVFDSAPPPPLARALGVALDIVAGDDGERLRARLDANVALLYAALAENGVALDPGRGPVIPVPIGDAARALALGRALEARGIYAPAIRPPTVAPGRSQLRVTVRADHTPGDLRRFAREFAAVAFAIA